MTTRLDYPNGYAPQDVTEKSRNKIVLVSVAVLVLAAAILIPVLASSGASASRVSSATATPASVDATPPAPGTDAFFLNVLANHEFVGFRTTNAQWVQIGRDVCVDMHNGNLWSREVGALAESGNFSAEDAGYLVGAAVANYCPDMLSKIPHN